MIFFMHIIENDCRFKHTQILFLAPYIKAQYVAFNPIFNYATSINTLPNHSQTIIA
ncbi:hypothetical protein MNBD_GAMMA09-3447 [hydrothermal vent metagenome]|uniref:Uncharacterized protein n=1 Tax=hydrothermal vent metagenome TaxID=652676 RepID=A0A3B0XN83_9ZZZZ